MQRLGLRASEWILIAFFAYIALIGPFFHDRPALGWQPWLVLAAAAGLLLTFAFAETTRYARQFNLVRDWIPMALTLAAFREMELFVPTQYNANYESAWIRWDIKLLDHWQLKRAIEAFGPLVPTGLELCYLLVYGLGTFCIVTLWRKGRRPQVDHFYVVMLTGTLLAYALFPFFPSRPPRFAFPQIAIPANYDPLRRLNLSILDHASIHSAVFPSAHVSSAFSAAWAMFLVLPREHWRYAWIVLVYAVLVAIATVYGRYHYATDALAGFLVSLVAGLIALYLARASR